MRRLISKILPESIKSVLRVIKRKVRYIIYYKGDIITKYELHSYGVKTKHTFFGYYDISPFNPKTNEIIYLELSEDKKNADIVLEDIESRERKKIAITYAWNWQQGSRLRWFPNSTDEIIFNDYRNRKYIARVINVRTGLEREIDFPIYDIEKSGKHGLSLDFERLGVLRPGYGYTVERYSDSDNLEKLGIDLIDLDKNTSKRIITYKELAELLNKDKKVSSGNYINHISFSPSGDKFMFFWLTIVGNVHKAYLIVYVFNTKKLIPLETKKKVSHYQWQDDENILATSYDEKTHSCRYYIYSINGKIQVVCPNSLQCDGHPSRINEKLFLTDSYPDFKYYQRLWICNKESDSKETILEIQSIPIGNEEERTDLHPRIHKKMICFDANVTGKRKLYILKGALEKVKMQNNMELINILKTYLDSTKELKERTYRTVGSMLLKNPGRDDELHTDDELLEKARSYEDIELYKRLRKTYTELLEIYNDCVGKSKAKEDYKFEKEAIDNFKRQLDEIAYLYENERS